MILAGDIGGTKTNLAIFQREESRLNLLYEHTFPSSDFDGLSAIVRRFLKQPGVQQLGDRIHGACFGVAGPVISGEVRATNLPWIVSQRELAKCLNLPRVELINDLEATGWGVSTLQPEELVTLNPGDDELQGNRALIAAGTGLGEALLVKEGEEFRPVASEGGHTSFAPCSELEIELLNYLRRRWSHVSFERVLSGPGLLSLYQFLKDTGKAEEPEWLAAELQQAEDPSALISKLALKKESPICRQALDMFVAIYGSEAGNLVLTAKAVSGIFVGGGIAPKILEKLQDGTFVRAFTAKGRLYRLLVGTPVWVIRNPKTALQGAARFAAMARDA